MSDVTALKNRLAIAASIWREMIDEPLPKLPPGDPVAQVTDLELRLVDRLCDEATRASAREVADRTWELVHDRRDDDTVKRRVIDCHERLTKLFED